MTSGIRISGVMLHVYIDFIVAFTAFYIARMYWPGRFGGLFVFLGLSGLFSAFICLTASTHKMMWFADAVEGIIILLFIGGMIHFMIKYKKVLLPVMKRLK